MMKKKMTDADRLRALLKSAGLSQRGAAKALEIDERTMRRYVGGDAKIPEVVWLAVERLRDLHLRGS